MRKLIALFVLSGIPGIGVAVDWHCSNAGLGVRCDEGRCVASDEFTPSDITVQADGDLTVCAWSACWSGPGKLAVHGRHLMVSATDMARSGEVDERGVFMVGIDTHAGAGFLHGEGFAIPLRCAGR